MSISAAPGATFEATTDAFAHSATVGVRIRTSAGADFLARTVTGVTEDVTVGTSAVFRKSFTAPTTAGQYEIVWDNGTLIDTEELVVTYTPLAAATGSLYITRDEMRTALSYTAGATYADDDIDMACVTVSRSIDLASGTLRRFFQASETRYYTPEEYYRWGSPYGYGWGRGECRLEIDDITTCDSLTVDTAGDGTYATTWIEGTDFFLDPPNAALEGQPYTEVLLRFLGGRYFPPVQRAVKITGTFGWPAVPPQVSQYAKLFAAQLVLRSRQAPFGILMQGMEVGATARLMRVDPDYQRLLGNLSRTRPFL
jgi:hypothetical protein